MNCKASLLRQSGNSPLVNNDGEAVSVGIIIPGSKMNPAQVSFSWAKLLLYSFRTCRKKKKNMGDRKSSYISQFQ